MKKESKSNKIDKKSKIGTKHSSTWKKLALTVAIAIIFILFIGFGIEAFYDSPKRNDFCEDDIKPVFIQNENECLENGGEWEPYLDIPRKTGSGEYICTKGIEDSNGEFTFNCRNEESDTTSGWCDTYSKCNEEFKSVNDIYNRNVFIICIIIGVVTIFLGVMLRKESVGTGLFVGGVLTVLYGTIRYWNELGDYVRFFLLGGVLVLLIYLGYKKVKD